MKRHDALTKALAIAGTLALSAPLAAMLITGLVHSLVVGRLRVDYLMPAEMFPAALVGAALLVIAALRAHNRRALVLWSCA